MEFDFIEGFNEGQKCVSYGHCIEYLYYMAEYPRFSYAFRRGFICAIETHINSIREKAQETIDKSFIG